MTSARTPAPRSSDIRSAFLDYFRGHGGVAVFGYPTSEDIIENQRIVQGVQQAGMGWHQELPARQHVLLTALGWMAFKACNVDETLTHA